jgi:hypothetical protein
LVRPSDLLGLWFVRFRWTDINIVFVVLYSLVSWIAWFLVCKPLAEFWDKDLKPVCLPIKNHKAFALLNYL